MERLKSKSKLLIAFVLAAVLAMAGVGYALANPNNYEENAGISVQADNANPIYGLTYNEVKAKYPTAMAMDVSVYEGDQFAQPGAWYLNIDTPKNVTNEGFGLIIDNGSKPNPNDYRMVAYSSKSNMI